MTLSLSPTSLDRARKISLTVDPAQLLCEERENTPRLELKSISYTVVIKQVIYEMYISIPSFTCKSQVYDIVKTESAVVI